jgi:hypothetical protein
MVVKVSGRGSRKCQDPGPGDAVGCGASRVEELKRALTEQREAQSALCIILSTWALSLAIVTLFPYIP